MRRLLLIGALSFAAASRGIAADTPRLTPTGVGDLKIACRKETRCAGSTEAEVRRSFGPKLKTETRRYEAEPAHQVTFWPADGSRGVRYDTNAEGAVEAIFAGGRSIVYVEGCL